MDLVRGGKVDFEEALRPIVEIAQSMNHES